MFASDTFLQKVAQISAGPPAYSHNVMTLRAYWEVAATPDSLVLGVLLGSLLEAPEKIGVLDTRT